MERLTFAGIERKIHPLYKAYIGGVYDDREVIDSQDEEIIEDILGIYRAYGENRMLAGGEWTWIQEHKQKEYRHLLDINDKASLISMYRNFFRNQISFGISAPDVEGELDRQMLVNDVLLDIDTWKEFCGDKEIEELGIPFIGNPYGVLMDGTLVMYHSCRHYYHAWKLNALTRDRTRPVILEIGAGYGGVFYYMNRQRENFCYLVCDLMETLLTNYYFTRKWTALFKKKVRIKWALDGKLEGEDQDLYDLILIPATGHKNIEGKLDVAYNANSFSEMSYGDITSYFETIKKNRPDYIFHQNSNFTLWSTSTRGHKEILAGEFPIPGEYHLIYQAISPWTGAGGRYREYLYGLKS